MIENFNFNSRNFVLQASKSDLHEKPKKEEKKPFSKPVSRPLSKAQSLSEASTDHEEVLSRIDSLRTEFEDIQTKFEEPI